MKTAGIERKTAESYIKIVEYPGPFLSNYHNIYGVKYENLHSTLKVTFTRRGDTSVTKSLICIERIEIIKNNLYYCNDT